MSEKTSSKRSAEDTDENFLKGLARAFAGSVIFSFPVIMTMEMWSLGFTIPPYRLLIYILLSVPLLTGLSYFIGFKDTVSIADDVIDAFVGYAVGFVSTTILLYLLGIIDSSMSSYEIIGKISLQSVVAAIGAMYAQSELGSTKENLSDNSEKKKESLSYWGELFLMFVGALFLAMNPAPTEEIYLIAFRMSELQIILLALGSIIMMHAFVYTVGFRGQEEMGEETSFWIVFLRFTIVGYAIALLMSFYLLWTFGSFEGMSLKEMLEITIVLGFPAALGAAASRVII